MNQPTQLAVIERQDELAVMRAPTLVLEEARKAAAALTDVISHKKKKVIFGGEQYLEFEDWQTVARFYGITVRVTSTQFVEVADTRGFEAKAEAVRNDGAVISCAESLCMQDEPNWRGKPLFQLKSMAQTRACAKALRNVLAWVVVLAGYAPTPSEEMTHVERIPTDAKKSIGQMEMELKELYEDKFFTNKARADLKEWFETKPGYQAIKEQLEKSKDLIAKKKKSKAKPVKDELFVTEADAFDSENPPVPLRAGPPMEDIDYNRPQRD